MVEILQVQLCLGMFQESRDVITPLQLELDYDIAPNVPGISMGCDICPIRNMYSRTKEIRTVRIFVVSTLTFRFFTCVLVGCLGLGFYFFYTISYSLVIVDSGKL